VLEYFTLLRFTYLLPHLIFRPSSIYDHRSDYIRYCDKRLRELRQLEACRPSRHYQRHGRLRAPAWQVRRITRRSGRLEPHPEVRPGAHGTTFSATLHQHRLDRLRGPAYRRRTRRACLMCLIVVRTDIPQPAARISRLAASRRLL